MSTFLHMCRMLSEPQITARAGHIPTLWMLVEITMFLHVISSGYMIRKKIVSPGLAKVLQQLLQHNPFAPLLDNDELRLWRAGLCEGSAPLAPSWQPLSWQWGPPRSTQQSF